MLDVGEVLRFVGFAILRLDQKELILSNVLKLGEQFAPHRRDLLVRFARGRAHEHRPKFDLWDISRGWCLLPSLAVKFSRVYPECPIGGGVDAERQRRLAGSRTRSQLHVHVHLPSIDSN